MKKKNNFNFIFIKTISLFEIKNIEYQIFEKIKELIIKIKTNLSFECNFDEILNSFFKFFSPPKTLQFYSNFFKFSLEFIEKSVDKSNSDIEMIENK